MRPRWPHKAPLKRSPLRAFGFFTFPRYAASEQAAFSSRAGQWTKKNAVRKIESSRKKPPAQRFFSQKFCVAEKNHRSGKINRAPKRKRTKRRGSLVRGKVVFGPFSAFGPAQSSSLLSVSASSQAAGPSAYRGLKIGLFCRFGNIVWKRTKTTGPETLGTESRGGRFFCGIAGFENLRDGKKTPEQGPALPGAHHSGPRSADQILGLVET